jgi:hypothetical protein
LNHFTVPVSRAIARTSFQESVILDPVPVAPMRTWASVISPASRRAKIGPIAWMAVEASFVQAIRRQGGVR